MPLSGRGSTFFFFSAGGFTSFKGIEALLSGSS
jgi:hypothetical protein